MSDLSSYHAEITEIIRRLGGPLGKESVLASQVLKRAPQIAQARNISEVEAVQYLLKLISSGSQGILPPDLALSETSEGLKKQEKCEKDGFGS